MIGAVCVVPYFFEKAEAVKVRHHHVRKHHVELLAGLQHAQHFDTCRKRHRPEVTLPTDGDDVVVVLETA
jgi:hypothetical protein